MVSGLWSNVAGSPRTSSNDREGAQVANQAPAILCPTSAATSKGPTNESTRRTINLSNLRKGELLSMLRDYICTMSAFAAKKRNVHRELKDNLTYAGKVMTRYM